VSFTTDGAGGYPPPRDNIARHETGANQTTTCPSCGAFINTPPRPHLRHPPETDRRKAENKHRIPDLTFRRDPIQQTKEQPDQKPEKISPNQAPFVTPRGRGVHV
jgi:hypothetical protein